MMEIALLVCLPISAKPRLVFYNFTQEMSFTLIVPLVSNVNDYTKT